MGEAGLLICHSLRIEEWGIRIDTPEKAQSGVYIYDKYYLPIGGLGSGRNNLTAAWPGNLPRYIDH